MFCLFAMAGTKTLESQLLDKLQDEGRELSERFKVAECVFTSDKIPLLRKEEIILEWFKKEISSCSPDIHEDTFPSLERCLRSEHFMNSRCEISSSVLKGIINVFSDVPKISNEVIQAGGRSCLVSLLESEVMQELLCREVELLYDVIKWYSCCKVPPIAAETETVGRMYSLMSKHSILFHEMNIEFIKELFVCLCDGWRRRQLIEPAQLCSQTIEDCIHQIISKDSSFTENFLENFYSKKLEEETYVNCFIKLLKKLPGQQDCGIVESCYLHFLSAVFRINKNDHNKIFKVLICLCKCLGINVKGMISIDLKPKKNWSREESCKVITEMINFVDCKKLSIHCENDDVNITVWFTSMIIGMTAIMGTDLTSQYVDMVCAILHFDPLVVDSAHKPLCDIMLCRKADDAVKLSYQNFLKCCLHGASQTSRFQKFITKFFSLIGESMKFTIDAELSVEDILPEEVKDTFCTLVSKLPGTQVIAIARCFIYNLQTICLRRLEQGFTPTDVDFIVYVEVITRALSYFLKGVKVTDYTTPTIIKEKLESTVLEIEECLGSIIEILLDDKKLFDGGGARVVAGIVHVCEGVGWTRLLQWQYDGPPRPLDQLDLPVFNLTLVHPYLPPDKWERLAALIQSSSHQPLKHAFWELVMQKVRGVSGLEEGEAGPSTAAALYLLQEASPDWLWGHAPLLAPLLHDNELLGLLNLLRKAAGLRAAPWARFLSTPHLTENKRIVVAASVAMLNTVAKYMNKNVGNGALIHSVMAQVPVGSLLEYELSRLLEDSKELEDTLQECLTGVAKQLRSLRHKECASPRNEDLHLDEFIELLTGLPYEECSQPMQVCIIGAFLGLLNDLPRQTNKDHLILAKLSQMLEECRLEEFGRGVCGGRGGRVLELLLVRGEGWEGHHQLITRWARLAFRQGCSVSKLVASLDDQPTVDTLWQYSALISVLHPAAKDDIIWQKEVERWLRKVVDRSTNVLTKSPPCLQTLPIYPVVLRQTLDLPNRPSALLDNLTPYLHLAVDNFSEGEHLIMVALKYLQEKLPENFLEDLWKKNILVQKKPNSKLVELFLKTASVDLLKTILDDLQLSLDKYATSAEEHNTTDLERGLVVWSELVCLELHDKTKVKLRGEALSRLMAVLLAAPMDSTSGTLAILSFLALLIEATHVRLSEEVVDGCLVVVERTPLTRKEDLTYADAALTTLLALVWFRKNLMEDRLPALLAVLRSFAHSLAALASPDLQDSSVLLLLEAALVKFNKGIQLLIKNKKQITRVAPYLISDVLKVFQKYQIHHKVKALYVEGLNSLLCVCDEHGTTFLSSALEPASKELFKTYYQQYNTSYKYRGKI